MVIIENGVLKRVELYDIKNGTYIFPNNVNIIGMGAFWNCTSLKQLIVPNSVKNINRSAFGLCTELKEIIIPDTVTFIGQHTFSWCKSLKKIQISKNIKLSSCWFDLSTNQKCIVYQGEKSYTVEDIMLYY